MLHDFEWNEADLPPTHELHSVVLSLIAFGPNRYPSFVGTAFVVGAYGNHAVAVTAAHNLYEGVSKIQNPTPSHHASTLREFLPRFEEVAIDRTSLRAVYQVGRKIEMCVIGVAIWDKARDVAVLAITPQSAENKTQFERYFRLERVRPSVGDTVGALGFADMATNSFVKRGDIETSVMTRRLVLRAGRIKALHLEGHILCRGPSIETTIPVFAGMSGGPVFLMPKIVSDTSEMVPFALISHDPEDENDNKFDRSLAGSSIAAILPVEIADQNTKVRDIIIRVENARVSRDDEIVKGKDRL